MIKTLVVGYDQTPPADRALERAAQLAEKFGSTLIVVSVAPVLMPATRGGGGIDPADSPEKHRQELQRAREVLEARGVQAEYVPAAGEPADALVDVATERGADMIVVGTREPGLIARVTRSSVSRAVTHHAHCDVLLVH